MSNLMLEQNLTGSKVLDRLSRLMPHLKHRFVPDQPFKDGAFDSLDLVELLCVIESEFAISLVEQDLATVTVGQLAELISGRVSENHPILGEAVLRAVEGSSRE